MAHTCPDCWLLCHCGGDIDDCCFDDTEDQMRCSHCDGKDDDLDEDVNDPRVDSPAVGEGASTAAKE